MATPKSSTVSLTVSPSMRQAGADFEVEAASSADALRGESWKRARATSLLC